MANTRLTGWCVGELIVFSNTAWEENVCNYMAKSYMSDFNKYT